MFRDLNCAEKKPLKTFTNFISEKISVEVGTSIPNGEMFLYFQVISSLSNHLLENVLKKKKEMGRLSRLEDENCFIKNRMHRSKKKWPKVFLLMTFLYSKYVKDR